MRMCDHIKFMGNSPCHTCLFRDSVASELEMADVGSNPLLDLSFLSEEEREKIERVLKADQALQLKNTVCSR